MAGATSAVVVIRFIADKQQAVKDTEEVAGRFGKFGATMRKAVVPAAAVATALIGVGTAAVKQASDLQQAQGAVETVYGRSEKAVTRYARTSIDRLGLTAAEYLNASALMGGALQNAGFSAAQAANMSDKALGRAADLAAAYGGTTAQAMDAIQAAVSRQEFDPLERLNVTLNATQVNAELAARGQSNLTGAALRNAKAQATLDLIYQQSNKVAGQFARESDTAAVAQQKASAAIRQAGASIATSLLPAVAAVAMRLASMANWVSRNSTTTLALVGVIGGLAAAILLVNGAMSAYAAYQAVVAASTALTNSRLAVSAGVWAIDAAAKAKALVVSKAVTVAQWAQNAAFLASPITWVVLGVLALVAAFIVLWKRSSTFRAFWIAMWAGIRAAFSTVVNWIRSAWSTVMAALRTTATSMGAGVRAVWNAIRSAASAVASAVRGAFSGAFAAIRSAVGTVRAAFSSAFGAVRSIISGAAATVRALLSPLNSVAGAMSRLRPPGNLSGPFTAVKSVIESVIGAVGRLIGALGRIRVPKIKLPRIPGLGRSLVPGYGGGAPSAAGYTLSPGLARAGMGRAPAATTATGTGAGEQPITVVINLDGHEIGRFTQRQVDSALASQARRIVLRGVGA